MGANVVVRGTGDFNGDGQSDILFQDTGSGTAYVWNLDGTTVSAYGQVGWVQALRGWRSFSYRPAIAANLATSPD